MRTEARDALHRRAERRVPLEELARRQGIRPIRSVNDLARDDIFETDQELDDFLAFVPEQRHSAMA